MVLYGNKQWEPLPYINSETFINQLISLWFSIGGASDPTQGSQYTFRLVQICTTKPSKLVFMTDKKKHRLLCMRKVYKAWWWALKQAFYRICCTHAGNRFTMARSAKQLLVKLGGSVAAVSLAVCSKALMFTRAPATMLAARAFHVIRHKPNSMTVLSFPDHGTRPLCPTQPQIKCSCKWLHHSYWRCQPISCQQTTPTDQYKQRHGLHASSRHQVSVPTTQFSRLLPLSVVMGAFT